MFKMFASSTEEVTDGYASACEQSWGTVPKDKSGLNETSSCVTAASSASSKQSLNEGSTSSRHGPSSGTASGDVLTLASFILGGRVRLDNKKLANIDISVMKW